MKLSLSVIGLGSVKISPKQFDCEKAEAIGMKKLSNPICNFLQFFLFTYLKEFQEDFGIEILLGFLLCSLALFLSTYTT